MEDTTGDQPSSAKGRVAEELQKARVMAGALTLVLEKPRAGQTRQQTHNHLLPVVEARGVAQNSWESHIRTTVTTWCHLPDGQSRESCRSRTFRQPKGILSSLVCEANYWSGWMLSHFISVFSWKRQELWHFFVVYCTCVLLLLCIHSEDDRGEGKTFLFPFL